MEKQALKPYDIRFENNGRGALISCTGAVDFEKLTVTTEQMYARDPEKRLRYQIWDTLGADRMEFTGEELRSMAMQDREATRDYPRQAVAIVGSDEVFRGASRIYGVYADVWAEFETRTFGSLPAAREWVAHWLRGPEPARPPEGPVTARKPGKGSDDV